ncbi:MAG: hypothetical protein ACREP9_08945, partial [Candidatus Dormibacteraceae bacterium]
IKTVTPTGVHFADHVQRKDKIVLRMNADCKTDEILVPRSLEEAKDWLDLALPYYFKTGLTGGSSFYPYVYTPYGDSVEYDLYQYFTAQWKLEQDSPVCKAVPTNPTDKRGVNWCFIDLVDSVREDYKNPKALSPGGQ